MSTGLTEEDMRRALGLDVPSQATPIPAPPAPPAPEPKPEPAAPAPTVAPAPARPRKRLSPELRVTMRVTKVFEGEETLFVYDAKTLSTFDAEQQAKKAAAKEKYKYFEVVSIKRVE